MVTCVVLIESVDSLNVSLIRDDKLLVNYIGDLPISHFINDKIDCLKVIFKPALCNSVPEDGYKLGNINVNGVNKDCVISYEDFNNLSSFSCKIKDIQIYNYLDVCKSLFQDKDKVLVVDSWSKSLASVLYIEYGSVVDFRRVRHNKLASVIRKMSDKYGYFDTINANNFYDIIGLKVALSNLDQVPKERLPFMKHLGHCLETKGIEILEGEHESLNWQEEDDDQSSVDYDGYDSDGDIARFLRKENKDSSEDYYARNLEGEDFEVESDFEDEYEDEEVVDKSLAAMMRETEEAASLGFFARLFGKKKTPSKKNYRVEENKASGGKNGPSRFSKYAEYDEDEDEYENVSFSQIAVGDHRASRKSNGNNPNVRNYSAVDYAFYVSFIVFVSCALIFGGLQFIYKEKVNLLSSTYGSAVKMKNQMQTSVSLAENPASSPAIKVSLLNNLSLPSSFNMLDIDYSGNEYTVTLSIDVADNIDDFASFLPDGIVLSKIIPKISDEVSKLYDIILVTS